MSEIVVISRFVALLNFLASRKAIASKVLTFHIRNVLRHMGTIKENTMNRINNSWEKMTLCFMLLLILSLLSCKQTNNKTEVKTEVQSRIGIIDSTFHFKDGILSIFEDSRGNFWFGTKENGVCKFDGNNYTYFTVGRGFWG